MCTQCGLGLQPAAGVVLPAGRLQSTILGLTPNMTHLASNIQDLPPLHSTGTAALMVQERAVLLPDGPGLKEKTAGLTEEFSNTCKTTEELGEVSEQFYKYALQLVEMLDMCVPAVAKLKCLLDRSFTRHSDITYANKQQKKLQILGAVSLENLSKMMIPMLSMPEYALIRNYLEHMVELLGTKVQQIIQTFKKPKFFWIMTIMPWKIEEKNTAENQSEGPILCFDDPPGVGETNMVSQWPRL
ncbi:hypothetical protein HPG69_018008 [Diceros bicornis minor]|uniref:Uncharacterized protein n=1 Tax=Diceros bicornis minor TaxID=77932 RepID=A0A7J7F3J9_DICBM|nr:hypothetical protein HPG69_018008 [Diceros bicornis minor]